MFRKSLSSKSRRVGGLLAAAMLVICAASRGAETFDATRTTAKFLGASTCASASCHGGGGEDQNQFLVWSQRDFHSQRPFATLTTARSKQIGEALGIKNPPTDIRCTSCHAPLQEVPTALRGEAFNVSEGVSCASCHGPAENWLRAHTRADWTRADRTFAGLRDLKNIYVRANTCVACHQTVERPLLEAGHPELIFELDGQSVSQPKHWKEDPGSSGAQAWFVGQAVALREMSWQLSRESASDEKLNARWGALFWLMQRLDGLNPRLPSFQEISEQPTGEDFQKVQKTADELARLASETPWTEPMTQSALKILAQTGRQFREKQSAKTNHARRAERLVLALDRLLAASSKSSPLADAKLNQLFTRAQSIPDFDPEAFAELLDEFAGEILTVSGN